VYPGLAIHESLVDWAGPVEVMFVGVVGGLEEQILASRGVRHVLIPGRGLRGAALATKLAAPLATARSVLRAAVIIRRFRPDVVVGTGGYASAAAVIAALLLRIPVVLQEQNSVPGLVNRRLARFADLVLLSYAESRRYISSSAPTSVVGNPLRAMPRVSRDEAAKYFGLDPKKQTVLIVGGSRGARSLNLAGAGAAVLVTTTHDAQFVLLTGERDYETARTSLGDLADRVKVTRYLDDMHMAYAVADLAVARAGASSVFELASWGVPTVFVPYPHAADDHQARNVLPLIERGAAVVLPDAEVDANNVAARIRALLDDEPARVRMSRAMVSWSRPDAARAAAALIIDVAKKKLEGTTAGTRPPSIGSSRRSSLQVVRR
jgi:UDP-N-acetylglucosamine--N-acetylmuramyl-(pentapeptide) pyrophosphoryl-undecaprenol N-acetylglucosamine transferase